MTTSEVTTTAATTSTAIPFPTRHRSAEERGRRIARMLLLATGIDRDIDEQLMDRIGRALREKDELGATLAVAMRLPRDHPEKVTHRALAEALAAGRAPAGAPPALAAYLQELATVPAWVDWERVERGAVAARMLGPAAADVLLQISLIGGYRFGGIPELLMKTGGLGSDVTLRRLGETQTWTVAVSRSGALRPGGEAWRLTAHVRAMHALVNAGFAAEWDVDTWGLPINQADQAGTIGLFDSTVLLGTRVLGVPLSRQERDDVMHLWKYVGWLMGVHPDFLTDDEDKRNRLNHHILIAAAGQTPAGRDLARATVDTQAQRAFGHRSALLERAHQRYARARVLSMMTVLLGPASMRDLGLPVRPPWAFALAFATNTAVHRTARVMPGGKAWLVRRGERFAERTIASAFRGEHATVGRLPGDDGRFRR